MKAAFRLRRKASSPQFRAEEPQPEPPRVPTVVPRLPALSSGNAADTVNGNEGSAEHSLGLRFSGLGLDQFLAHTSYDGSVPAGKEAQQPQWELARIAAADGALPRPLSSTDSRDEASKQKKNRQISANVGFMDSNSAVARAIGKPISDRQNQNTVDPPLSPQYTLNHPVKPDRQASPSSSPSITHTPLIRDIPQHESAPAYPDLLTSTVLSFAAETETSLGRQNTSSPQRSAEQKRDNSTQAGSDGAKEERLQRNSHDNHSIIAVRNETSNHNTHRHAPSPPVQPETSSLLPDLASLAAPPHLLTGEEATMMDRHYPSYPSFNRTKPLASSRAPTKPSVSTILESAKRANPAKPSSSSGANNGALSGNTLNSSASILSSASALVFPSSPGDAPPVQPSLFAYSSSSSSNKTPKKVKDSGASVHTAQTSRSTRTKSTERAIIRNARGEIEWKDAPPPPPPHALPSSSNHHLGAPSGTQPRRTPSPYQAGEPRPRTRSSGAPPSRSSDERRHNGKPHPSPVEAAFKLLGSSAAPQRPRNRRNSNDDGDGFHTADEDDLEAREWERKRELQMEADRLEVYRRQQAREEEERRARKRAERDRLAAEQLEREQQAEARRQAEREARRLAREKAEREEAERRQRQHEEAQRRRIHAQREAEEERLRREKEAEERRARRRQQEEDRRKREQEEAKRKAEEEAKRKEEERLAATEAERLAKEAAIQAEHDAVLERERQLVEAKRQVEEEDRAARQAGRRDDRRARRALAAGFAPGELDAEAQQSDEEDDTAFHDDAASDAASDVFVDAGTEDDADAEAKSGTDGSMARSTSNLKAPSSTDGSSDMPATPIDEQGVSMLPPPSSSPDMARGTSSKGGHGQVKFAAGTNGQAIPTAAPPAEKSVPYRSDRFRNAVRMGARRAPAAAESGAVPPSTSLLTATFAASEEEEGREDEHVADDEIVQPNGPYREGGITYGRGWCSHGLADLSLTIDHRRYVRTPRPISSNQDASETGDAEAATEQPAQMEFDEVMYSDLGELIWSATTPDVIARLISHLDYADVKALRQTSQSIRFALGQLAGREIVLARFLSPVGYQAWKPSVLNGAVVDKDPLPLSFSDCEAFLLSFDLLPEYALVAAEYARAPHKMDPRYPRLARATTRAYNRVLTRLRMQAEFYPTPSRGVGADGVGKVAISSPWKPGRAGFFRAWVPSTETGGWLSDTELARCERELFIAGVWSHLKKGDVVWDCAVGDERNQGKYIFDGRYLRDLSFMFDRGGHLPSWLNAFWFAPSYYHNVISSSDASQPVIYLDVLPWRDQIVSTMRLVQDQVETFSPQGARYRISKWLYRAVINVVPGAIISDEGLQVVDPGWHGKLVIETEGTAEHAKELISRCAGPAESAQTKARLLASVMDADGRPKVPKTRALAKDAKGNRVETTTPWAIVRARSRPGLIWIRPIDMRERVVF